VKTMLRREGQVAGIAIAGGVVTACGWGVWSVGVALAAWSPSQPTLQGIFLAAGALLVGTLCVTAYSLGIESGERSERRWWMRAPMHRIIAARETPGRATAQHHRRAPR